MSLILEALRKSEAERRRAQAPDLFAPAQVAVAPARRLPPAWLLGAGTLALVAIALLLARAFGPAPERPVSAQAAATSEPAVVAADAATGASPPAPRPAPVDPAPVRPTTAADPPPRLLPAAEAAAATAGEPPAGREARPGTAGTAAAAHASDGTGEAAPSAPSLPPPPAPASPTASAPQPPPVAGADAPMRLSELGGDARRQLPPLKLTMHMWNETAARRFVILDGRRLAEGDRIGAVRVAEIRRDGVLLDWNGQWLALPLR